MSLDPFELAAMNDVHASADRLRRKQVSRGRVDAERSRTQSDWRSDELNEQLLANAALARKNQELAEQLSNAKGLLRTKMIHSQAFLDTIKHLRQSWEPTDPKERAYKDDMNLLGHAKIKAVESNPDAVAKIEAEIETQTAPIARRRSPKP